MNVNKLVGSAGLGFDGCSVMDGMQNGVQKIICDKHSESEAEFFT